MEIIILGMLGANTILLYVLINHVYKIYPLITNLAQTNLQLLSLYENMSKGVRELQERECVVLYEEDSRDLSN